ncbi:unnamed protein product [Larinioides sclopetarius]|uniref:Thyroglobulin type-1 domain-containing protein n=1 Tax=Larinioides sclopetarius TaxID=280406 RepID=A0AAV2AQB4_9ARAC
MNMQSYVSFLLLVFVISFAFANGDGSDETNTSGGDGSDEPTISREERPCDYDRQKKINMNKRTERSAKRIRRPDLIKKYIPQCKENGYYKNFQCIDDEYCFCVNPYGEYVRREAKPEDCENN